MPEALFGLLGVLLGGAIGVAIELVRAKQDEKNRLTDARRQAYAHLIALSARLDYEALMLTRRVADLKASGRTVPIDLATLEPGPARETFDRFDRLLDDFTFAHEEVRLLGRKHVVAAAGGLATRIASLASEARAGIAEDDPAFKGSLEEVHRARLEVRELVRDELGVE
jgi:hypothetical protein